MNDDPSRAQRAAAAITVAARYYTDDNTLIDAAVLHTHGLSYNELGGVVAELAARLSIALRTSTILTLILNHRPTSFRRNHWRDT